MINYWPLIGIALVVIGFALKMNPMLVVTASAIATGLIAGLDLHQVISTFGKAFNDNRIIAIVWIVLPVIGLLERFGLQQRAAAVIRSMRNATTGRLLILYLIYRQLTAAIGLHSTAGHPQTVRPLVAPMALAAAEKQHQENPAARAAQSRMSAWSTATTPRQRRRNAPASSRAAAASRGMDSRRHVRVSSASTLPEVVISTSRSSFDHATDCTASPGGR